MALSGYPGGLVTGKRAMLGATCGMAAGIMAASCRCADISASLLFRLLAHACLMYTTAPKKTTRNVTTSKRLMPFPLAKLSPEILKIPMFSLVFSFTLVLISSAAVEDCFDPMVVK